MPRTRISEYSTTNSDNTDIEGINIAENCPPSGINNAIREIMVHLKEFQTGASGDSFTFAGGTVLSGTNTISGAAIISGNINSSGSANTFSGPVVMSGANTVALAAGAVGTPSLYANGDTNTGIFFPAADTIAFTEGGVEAMRIDSSGNVGIGTSSPVGVSGYTVATINNATNGGMLFLTNGTNKLWSYVNSAGVYVGSNSNDPLILQTNSLERARITGAGRLLVGTTSENTSGGVLQVSNGVTFPATQSASSDANTLDDYEEGTWTPTITSSGAAGTVTYTSRDAIYTKIGNIVTVQFDIRTSANTSTLSGNLRIGGLPFTVNSSGARPFGVLSPAGWNTAVNGVYVMAENSQTYCRVFGSTSSTYTALSDLAVTVIKDGANFYGSITYLT